MRRSFGFLGVITWGLRYCETEVAACKSRTSLCVAEESTWNWHSGFPRFHCLVLTSTIFCRHLPLPRGVPERPALVSFHCIGRLLMRWIFRRHSLFHFESLSTSFRIILVLDLLPSFRQERSPHPFVMENSKQVPIFLAFAGSSLLWPLSVLIYLTLRPFRMDFPCFLASAPHTEKAVNQFSAANLFEPPWPYHEAWSSRPSSHHTLTTLPRIEGEILFAVTLGTSG